MNDIIFHQNEHGVSVNLSGQEDDASCYNGGDPECWYYWDIGLLAKQKNLTEAEQHQVRMQLAEVWRELNKLKNLIPVS